VIRPPVGNALRGVPKRRNATEGVPYRGFRKGEKSVAKINIEQALFDRAKRAADAAGYSSVDEFVAHCIENEIQKQKTDEAEGKVSDQLRGLGYIE
jgi:hypothetical protein